MVENIKSTLREELIPLTDRFFSEDVPFSLSIIIFRSLFIELPYKNFSLNSNVREETYPCHSKSEKEASKPLCKNPFLPKIRFP